MHDAFQVPQTSRVSRFVEAFEIMQRLWTEDMVTFQGKHYVFKDVSINPKPVQHPCQCGLGLGLIRHSAHCPPGRCLGHQSGWTPGFIEEKLQLYRTALQECGRSAQVTDVILRRDLHLAATADIARREAQALFERGYRGFDRQAMAESLIVSGPEECIRYLESMQRLGITHVLFRCAVQDQSKRCKPSALSARGHPAFSRFFNSGMTYFPNSSMEDMTFSCGIVSVAMRNCNWSTPMAAWMSMALRQLSGSPETVTPVGQRVGIELIPDGLGDLRRAARDPPQCHCRQRSLF